MKELISVIIPCFKVSKFLDDTFASLEKQTYENLELIFVNDGSPDDCLEKIKAFCKNKPNCKIVDQENHGLSAARNSGIAIAEGEFLYFYDSDDLLSPNILEVLHKTLTENNCDMSICKYQRVKENFSAKNITSQGTGGGFCIYKSAEEAISQLLSTKVFDTCVWNKLYKHSIVRKFENYPNVFNSEIRYAEDIDFNVRYMQHITSAAFVSQKLYFYRMRKGSIIHSSFNPKMFSIFFGIDNAIEVCEKDFPSAAKYAKSIKCVFCTEMLYRMKAGNFQDKKMYREMYKQMKDNLKYIREGKKNPLYRRLFMWTVPIYFKLVLHKQLKKEKASKN